MPTCKTIRDVPPSEVDRVADDYRAAGYTVYTQEQGDGNFTVVACKELLTAGALAPAGAKSFAKSKARAVAAEPPLPGARKILCVHGVGHHEADPASARTWVNAISAALPGVPLELQFVAYDDLFAADPITPLDIA